MPDDETSAPCDCRNGMREVTDLWARQEAGVPRDADLEYPPSGSTAEQLAELAQAGSWRARAALERQQLDRDRAARLPLPETPTLDALARYASALQTVFPCPKCRPAQFRRWRHGCYKTGHVAGRCTLCRDAKAGA